MNQDRIRSFHKPCARPINIEDVWRSFQEAVEWYGDKTIYQEHLKPITMLCLKNVFTRLYPKRPKNLFVCANNMTKRRHRKEVSREIEKYCKHYDEECVVDFNFMVGNRDPYSSFLTAESEAYSPEAKYLKKKRDIDSNDMMWDLYKLLHYPSPVRFFVTLSSSKHHKQLLSATHNLIKAYSDTARSCDIFAVQVPTANLTKDKTLIAHWPCGRLSNIPKTLHRTLC